MKALSDVNKHSDEVLVDKFPIDQQVANRIIEKLYFTKDVKDLKQNLASRLLKKKQKTAQAKQKHSKENISLTSLNKMIRTKMSSDKVADSTKLYFSEFVSTVLDFELTKQEAFLDGFLQLF